MNITYSLLLCISMCSPMCHASQPETINTSDKIERARECRKVRKELAPLIIPIYQDSSFQERLLERHPKLDIETINSTVNFEKQERVNQVAKDLFQKRVGFTVNDIDMQIKWALHEHKIMLRNQEKLCIIL